MEAVFTKSDCAKLGSRAKVAIALRGDVSVSDEAIGRDRHLQSIDPTGSIEEFPVFVSLDLLVPSETGDGLLTGQKRVARHITPSDEADTPALAPMHPDPFTFHQRREHQWPAATALANAEDVDGVFDEPLTNFVELQTWRDDVIIIEQEDELGLGRINCCVSSHTDANVVLIEIDHLTMPSGVRVSFTETLFFSTVVHDKDLWLVDVLAQRFDQPMAGPWPMNRLDAKRDVCRRDCLFHGFTQTCGVAD